MALRTMMSVLLCLKWICWRQEEVVKTRPSNHLHFKSLNLMPFPSRGHSTTRWAKSYPILPPSPFSGKNEHFSYDPHLWHDPSWNLIYASPHLPLLVHVVIECPPRQDKSVPSKNAWAVAPSLQNAQWGVFLSKTTCFYYALFYVSTNLALTVLLYKEIFLNVNCNDTYFIIWTPASFGETILSMQATIF